MLAGHVATRVKITVPASLAAGYIYMTGFSFLPKERVLALLHAFLLVASWKAAILDYKVKGIF